MLPVLHYSSEPTFQTPLRSMSGRYGLLDLAPVRIRMVSDKGYRIQENTETPAHPSVDTVISRALERAADPRPADDPNGHFDQYIRDAIDRFGEDDVVDCIQLTIVEGYTHRMAGAAVIGSEEYVRGINVDVAATAYLRELHQERKSAGGS